MPERGATRSRAAVGIAVLTAVMRALPICVVIGLLHSPVTRADVIQPATLAAAIPAQPLAQALADFARQTGRQVLYVSEIARGVKSPGAPAGLSVDAALGRLLEGTGLGYKYLTARSFRLFTETRPQSRTTSRTATAPLDLEEVTVTATRRVEQLGKVPVDMAVWTADAMESSGIKGVTQLAALTPGVDFEALPLGSAGDTRRRDIGGDFYTELTIRGVTGRHGATTGVFVDDVPIPPARAVTYLRVFPVTFDLERVEILRGPQGVLLGDHTQGGAIHFITSEPSLSAFTGLAVGEWASNAHGSMSYEAGAAVGGPLVNDVLGFRVNGWYRSDGGYVDRVDPATGATVDPNSNRYVTESVHAAIAFAPTSFIRITPSVAYQSVNVRDTSWFYTALSSPGDGILKNGSPIQQPLDDAFYLTSLRITASLRGADLSAVTGYFDRTATAVASNVGLATHHDQKQHAFSQEVRLTSVDPDSRFTWIAGLFFSNEGVSSPDSTFVPPVTIADNTRTEQSERAAFGQISLKMTQRLSATIGLRLGRSAYDSTTETPPVFHAAESNTWTTPQFSLSYEAGEHNFLYAKAAKGYGSGGVYPSVPICGDRAAAYPPDALWSYELGTKSDLLNGELRLYTSVFHIRWNNGPQSYDPDRCEVSPIPGAAVSNGFSVSLQGVMSQSLIASLAVAYTNAYHAQTVLVRGALLVSSGDAVDGGGAPTPPWAITGSIERRFLLPAGVSATLRAEDVFRSANPGPFNYQDPASLYFDTGRSPDPSINLLNMRATFQWHGLNVAAFMNNALNAQPTLAPTGVAAQTLMPRTTGLSATWRFQI